ncbi:MAG: polysaccharide lyase 6 family protein, partial [Verrucomicrobiaceae bacterium]|nr:polysaccharide lyase 6 family protein [Verrucomicrobiaceae bacterium]
KDARLKLRASGTEDLPVTIKAETPGKVVLTGNSRLQLGGRFILVEGLFFQNPTGEESIELRIDSDEVAHECRVTRCAVVNTLPAADTKKTTRFISIYGREHRVDHCRLEGKTTAGPSMVVWLSNEAKDWGRHRIDHNLFGPRERLGKNGGETIRLGDSDTSMLDAKCVVEHNLFEKCNGEAECISNKSCGNTYWRNTFVEVSGTLTLRHGNRCRVVENAFLGNHAKGCGGVRIIGEDHVVSGNYFEALDGSDERSAICLMAGIPNSPANGYFQVKNTLLKGNLVVDCKSPLLYGFVGSKEATLAPLDVKPVGNRFTNPTPKSFPAHPGLLWEQKDITKPEWIDKREAAGTGWE